MKNYSLLFLCVLLACSLLAGEPLQPKVHQGRWPHFCFHHLNTGPESCSSYIDDENGDIKLELHVFGYAEAYYERELIDKISSRFPSIPTNPLCACDYAWCPACQQSVKRAISYEYKRSDISESNYDKQQSDILYQCDCTEGRWLDPDYLYDFEIKIYKKWIFCKAPTIYPGYVDRNHKFYFQLLDNYLSYLEQNPTCDCYWPQVSKTARTISNRVYDQLLSVLEITQIDKKKQKHILKVGENQKISLLDSIPSDIYFYPPFVATSKHALLSKFLSNAFFYSDYHKVLNDFDRLCQQESTDYPHFCSIILESQNEIQDSFLDLCTKCLKKHPHLKIYYERGMVLFNQGDNLVALDDIRKLITYAEKHKYHEFLTSNLYLQEGQLLNESLSYDDAIIALTKAIEKDPKNQEAYFERAISYFEIGDFSKALSDYLASGIHTKTADHVLVGKLKYINFGQGIIRGIWKGGQDSVTEFVPSLLSCYRGISRGVWAFVSNPIIVSHDFINSACACIEYIKNHTQKEKLSKLVPEIQACLSRWNHLDDELKGIHIGHVIGKYGIDIFLGAGSVKAMRLYRDLRRANVVMTLETAVVSPKLANEILEQTIREEALEIKF